MPIGSKHRSTQPNMFAHTQLMVASGRLAAPSDLPGTSCARTYLSDVKRTWRARDRHFVLLCAVEALVVSYLSLSGLSEQVTRVDQSALERIIPL